MDSPIRKVGSLHTQGDSSHENFDAVKTGTGIDALVEVVRHEE